MREGVDRRGWLALLAQGVAGWLFARHTARAAPAPAPPPPQRAGDVTYYPDRAGYVETSCYDSGAASATQLVYSTYVGGRRLEGPTPPPARTARRWGKGPPGV